MEYYPNQHGTKWQILRTAFHISRWHTPYTLQILKFLKNKDLMSTCLLENRVHWRWAAEFFNMKLRTQRRFFWPLHLVGTTLIGSPPSRVLSCNIYLLFRELVFLTRYLSVFKADFWVSPCHIASSGEMKAETNYIPLLRKNAVRFPRKIGQLQNSLSHSWKWEPESSYHLVFLTLGHPGSAAKDIKVLKMLVYLYFSKVAIMSALQWRQTLKLFEKVF